MPRAAFVYDDAMSRHELRGDHPMRPVRLRYTYELLRAYGAFDHEGATLIHPRLATDEELEWLHTPEYVSAVRGLSEGAGEREAGRFNFSAHGDNPYYPGMYDAAVLSTGASLLAAEMVANGTADVAFNISGGLHHAAAGQASGFCVFNDPALAIHYFLRRGMRVAYVDIDAHHGDGVQDAFFADNRVLTISVHESGRYLFPGTGFVAELGQGEGRGYSVNLPLFPYTGGRRLPGGLQTGGPAHHQSLRSRRVGHATRYRQLPHRPPDPPASDHRRICGGDPGIRGAGAAVAGHGGRRVRLDGSRPGLDAGLRGNVGRGVAGPAAQGFRLGAWGCQSPGQLTAGNPIQPALGHQTARRRDRGRHQGASLPGAGRRPGVVRYLGWSGGGGSRRQADRGSTASSSRGVRGVEAL